MKKLATNLLLIFCLLAPTAQAADVVAYVIRGFLSSFQVNTTTLPKVYISWNSVVFGEKFCKSFDLSRWNEAPREKMDLHGYIFDKLIPFFGSPPLTPEEEAAHCWGGAVIKPWRVKDNGTMLDRPTYDLLQFQKDGGWITNGRVNLLTNGSPTICDPEIIRKTPGYSYQKVVNKTGTISLTACVQ